MYLKKTKTRNGKIHLAIVDTYYDKSKKCSRTKTIESLGYLEELEKLYDDPISHFSKQVDDLKNQKVDMLAPIKMEFKHSDTIDPTHTYSKNFGYTALSKIYHDLGIHTFFTNRQRYSKEEYDADTIMKLLVYSRLLYPSSKKKTYENRGCFFEKENYTINDIYRSLSFFNKHKENLMLWINDRIKQLYGRDTSLVYYDVTNYYFETDDIDDDFKKKGVSKEHRPNPIGRWGCLWITMGFLLHISYSRRTPTTV